MPHAAPEYRPALQSGLMALVRRSCPVGFAPRRPRVAVEHWTTLPGCCSAEAEVAVACVAAGRCGAF